MDVREHTELAPVSVQMIARTTPMDALAAMSDQEFEAQLDAVKRAQERVERIQRELMIKDVDYGVIPGTAKPTLLKPGAEKLCKMYRLVSTADQREILGDGVMAPHIRVLTTCCLHMESGDGPIVAYGAGAANSWERKYRYRDAQRKCPNCGATALRRSKYPDRTGGLGWYCWDKRGGCGASFGEHDPVITNQQLGQVDNADPFDGENTLIKMSAKRAYVDATLRATATSGLFAQDLEDMDIGGATPEAEEVQPASAPGSPSPGATPTRPQQPPKAATPQQPVLICTDCKKPIGDWTNPASGEVFSAAVVAKRMLRDLGVQTCYDCGLKRKQGASNPKAANGAKTEPTPAQAEPYDPEIAGLLGDINKAVAQSKAKSAGNLVYTWQQLVTEAENVNLKMQPLTAEEEADPEKLGWRIEAAKVDIEAYRGRMF